MARSIVFFILVLVFTFVVPMESKAQPGMPQGGMSTLCRFTNGPRAGQVQDYAPMAPLPVGTPCHDGQGSTGVVVGAGGGMPQGGMPQGGIPQGGVSTLCRFTNGPRAGQVQDYAPMAPLPVGTPCHDGQGSTGVVVSRQF